MSYSPAPLALDRAKPSPWNVEGAFADLVYQSLWDGLLGIYDIGPQDLPPDLGPNRLDVTGIDSGQPVGTRQITEWGLGRRFTAGSGQGLIVPNQPVTNQVSVFVVLRTTGSLGSNDHIFSRHPGWAITNEGTTGIRFGIDTGSQTFVNICSLTGQLDDLRLHVLGATYDGTRVRTFFDGVEQNTIIRTGNIDLTGETRIAGYWDSSGLAWGNGDLLVCAYWGRALSPEEVAQFSSDPFGLIRPNWDYVTTSAFDPANLQSSVDGGLVTLTYDPSF